MRSHFSHLMFGRSQTFDHPARARKNSWPFSNCLGMCFSFTSFSLILVPWRCMLNFHFGMNTWIQLLIDFSDMIYYIVSFPTSRERSHIPPGEISEKHRLKSTSCEKDVSFEECFLGTFFCWKLKLLPWKLRVIPWKSRKLVQMYSLLKACPFKKGTFLRSFSGPWGRWMSPRWSDVWRIIVLLLVKKRGVDAIQQFDTRTVVIQLVVWRTVVIQLDWNVFFLFNLYHNSLMQLHHSKYLSKILVLNECFNIEIFLCWKETDHKPLNDLGCTTLFIASELPQTKTTG